MRSIEPLCRWRIIPLALTMAVVSMSRASEYEYLSWKSDLYNGGRSYGKPPQCVDIPEDLRLCHNVGYNQMLLPNLLEHETMAEVKQQAGSWVPLVHKSCHPGTQVFLCSLFAPVCLERPIYPCRWLCEAVRDGCTPIMESFGFPWPEMLTCDKFPQDDVCIAMTAPNATEATKPTGYSPICPPCDNEMKTDIILEHMCASEFGRGPSTAMRTPYPGGMQALSMPSLPVRAKGGWYPRRSTPGDGNRGEVTLAPSAGNTGAGHPDTDSSKWR
ncbi:secreted frizzled-related protein 1 isoform X3 [Salvelinus sp. IW2-2015]|uniref:secreted frizzled-related protein 1 isoform X3 n=1 Tax=Salvelinus sp. IW2-2015 TaxID=2691554 RepID=UPI000CDF8CBD|nr:secreted frizzled-related protein 1 isoform X2 [Salvelinus alpinus]